MANHVNSYINFYEINEAAKEKLKQMLERVELNEYRTGWFGHIFANEDLNKETTEKYNWMVDNVGAKWCHLEDSGEDWISLISAWSAPEEGLVRLLQILEQYDPNMITVFNYEDEMPNFFGCYVYKGSEMIDGREDDSEEIHEMMMDNYEDLAAEWNEDEEEFTEEGYEIWNDNIWEMINEVQENCTGEILRSLSEEE